MDYPIDKMQLTIDAESVNIYIDNGEETDPTHIAYWYFEEWEEDAETVVPAMLTAIDLFHRDKKLLLKTLGYIK
jgi:hypothetical protein